MKSISFVLDLGIVSAEAEWDLIDYDKQCLIRILRKIPGHEALYEPLLGEYAGEVVESIKRLEHFLEGELLKLPDSTKIDKPLRVLSGFCRGFLTKAKEVSQAILYYIDLYQKNAREGIEIPADWKAVIEHYQRVGSPDLMVNTKLSVFDIRPVGYQSQFQQALGQLRGSFGTVLSIICPLSNLDVPVEVQQMIEYAPEADTQSQNNSH